MITSTLDYGNLDGFSRFESPRASMTGPSGTDGITMMTSLASPSLMIV